MASYNKFEHFAEALMNKEIDLFGTGGDTADVLRVYLSNAAPNGETHDEKSDIAEISTGNGYDGPVDTQNVGTRSGGTVTVAGESFEIEADGGTIGPFRYVVLFDDTATGDVLLGWWDRGEALTLQQGETFAVKFNNADVGSPGTILTLA